MSSDDYGHDAVAEGSRADSDAKEAGLDPADIVRALTGVVLAVLMCQAPECIRDRDCSSGQRCVGGACKVKNNRG